MKRIFRNEFNNILKYIPNISEQERMFLLSVFENDLVDGLTEFELKQKIERLKFNEKDPIDREEAETVKKKLLEAMERI